VELGVVCLLGEVPKGVLHGVELQQLHMAHRRQHPAGQARQH
jgi:hypothetical protein